MTGTLRSPVRRALRRPPAVHRFGAAYGASGFQRTWLKPGTEIALVFRRLRFVIDAEQPFKQGGLFVATVGFDAVRNSQRSDNGGNSGEQIAVVIKDRRGSLAGEIDILILAVRNGDFHAILRIHLGNSGGFLRSQIFADDNRSHLHEISGFCVSISKYIFQKVTGGYGIAGAPGDQDEVLFIGRFCR